MFKKFLLEKIDLGAREVIIKAGEILYHGTGESFDTRKPKPGGYDDVFWTTDNLMIARTYIPALGSYTMTDVRSILQDERYEKLRQSLGLNKKVVEMAWAKERSGYQNLVYWEEKHKEFMKQANAIDHLDDKTIDEFFAQWKIAEDNYVKAKKDWRTAESILKNFVIMKMKKFGYSSNNSYFNKLAFDKDDNLLPSSHRLVGKVLKVVCNRDFKFYNYAYGKEGDLTDVDYNKIGLFRKIEDKGYDGVIINDYAQSQYHGNYGHISFGFFKNSVKDLTIKQIRNQTHPEDKEWQ